MKIKEIKAKVPLYKHKKKGLPYDYDLNIYRGCSHGCVYCYGRKSHKYLNSDNFEKDIFVKTNIAEKLDEYLKNNSLKNNIINLGGVCDSYQEIESEYKLMPKVLKVLIKHKQPTIITTKSAFIREDLALIEELSNSASYVNTAITITNVKVDVSNVMEPGASLPQERFEILKEIKGKSMFTALHFMPILPYFSDDDNSLEQIVEWASMVEVDYMLSGMLYLTKNIKPRYYKFLSEYYPEYLDQYKKLYKNGGADKTYKSTIHKKLAELRKKYNVNNSYAKFLPNK
jgi:DNA repair photolyase